MTTPKTIHPAINAIMQTVGYVQKKRTGKLNYAYAGEAALIAALRPAMVAHGVYMHPLKVVSLVQDTYTTSRGSTMNRTVINAIYRFTHADSGTSIDVFAIGEGADIGDKSANKASTGAFKYALRQTFMIETGDDPDKFPSEARGQPARKSSPAPPEKKLAPLPFATPEPAGAPQDVAPGAPAPGAAMSMEMASTVKNRAGVPYVDIDSERLTYMSRAIFKALKEPHADDEIETLKMKRDAIGVILANR